MNIKRPNLSHGAIALLFLCGSYIAVGIALVSSVKELHSCSSSNSRYTTGGTRFFTYDPMFFAEGVYLIAYLLWMFALLLTGFGRGKDENKFLLSLAYYLSFIPITLAFAYYVISGVSPFEIVEGLLPPAGISCEGPSGW